MLNARQTERLDTIQTIYGQQKDMYDHRTHSVSDRIVSVSQPFVRPIVRGKAGEPVEFRAKLDISVVDGWTRLEVCSFDAYNEAGKLQEMTERFRNREGHDPSRILKIYRNRENLSYCKEHGIRLSGPALGRPGKGETRDKAQDDRDECERVEVERRFSLAKRKCGMGLVAAKLRETAAHVIAMSVLVLNLRKIQHAFLRLLTYLLAVFLPQQKMVIVSVDITIEMSTFDGMLAQLKLRFNENGYVGCGIELIPVLTSSKAHEGINDYCPVIAEGEDRERIFEKVQADTSFPLTEQMFFYRNPTDVQPIDK